MCWARRWSFRARLAGRYWKAILPPSELVTLTTLTGGNFLAGNYNYKLVWVDANGNESLASVPTRTITGVVDGDRVLLTATAAGSGRVRGAAFVPQREHGQSER